MFDNNGDLQTDLFARRGGGLVGKVHLLTLITLTRETGMELANTVLSKLMGQSFTIERTEIPAQATNY